MQNFPYRLAAVDLDHTLLGPDYRISAANREAIKLLQDQGVLIVLASGRIFQHMTSFHDELELDTELICCNGALITKRDYEATLRKEFVPPQEAQKLIDFGIKAAVTTYSYLREGVYVSYRQHWNRYDNSHCGEVPVFFEQPHLEQESEVTKVVYSMPPAEISSFCQAIAPLVIPTLDCQITGPETIEVVSRGADKALAFARLASHYGFSQEETLAFGDGTNDASLLKWAGLGVAMAESAAITAAAADLQAPGGVPENSFARAVEIVMQRISSFIYQATE